jgi:hypothetical protein
MTIVIPAGTSYKLQVTSCKEDAPASPYGLKLAACSLQLRYFLLLSTRE